MTEDNEDFAALFAKSTQAKRIVKGQSLEGTVVAIGPEVAFVDVGGKGEAVIAVDELKGADGALEVAVGDRIHAVVTDTEGGLTLSRRLAGRAATNRQLEEAAHSGLPVEGRVERVVKGGFEVRIGGARAFCPFSQIDITRSEPASHEGRVYEFRIIEFKDGGRNLVVSRRALLEEQQQAAAADVRRAIVPDAILHGTVASVRDFGAFVDLGGGVQGLLHISEMGWSRVADASQVVKPGDEVTVKVLRVDPDMKRISLGLKQLTEDPWTAAAHTYAVGQVCTGRVTRVEEFGAFVELEPGIEALAHVSTFPPTGRSNGWRELVPVDSTGAFEVVSVDLANRRIGVAPLPEGSARAGRTTAAEIVPGAHLTGKVQRHDKAGVFVFLAPGRTGLIPLAETGIAKEGDVVKAFPVGTDIEVIVLEVDPSGRRIRLSAKAVQDQRDAAEVRAYTERLESAPAEGFGSLADKLRGALQQRKP